MIIYVVKPGDTLYSISRRYNVPQDKIASDNQLANPDRLVVGQTIVILPDNISHTVTKGQSLYSIARNYGIPLEEIIRANPDIRSPYRLDPGMVITIPKADQKLGTIYVNGYTYPNINMDLLQSVLPYLTYLSIFSTQARPDGSLIPVNDAPVIAAARNAGVAPFMVVTNMVAGGGFNSDLGHILLTNRQVRDVYINNVIQMLRDRNYYGLNIDFEYIYPEDRESYNNFLSEIATRLHTLGYPVMTAVAPKNRENQTGLLYEAHDYPAHGRLMDHVILMTYEWGYTRGPAMAISPVNEVRRVLNYATSAIPAYKILMGMPNYAYDWTLPFVRGSSARQMPVPEAVELAANVGAHIKYNTTSQAPYFNYYDQAGRRHEVWFEDARSVEAKLRLVNQYGLGGVSYWTVNTPFPQNWLVLDSLYNIRKVL